MDYDDEKYWDELCRQYPYITSFGTAHGATVLVNKGGFDISKIRWLQYYTKELSKFSSDVDRDINYHMICLNSEGKHEIMVAKENSKLLLEKVDKLLSLLQL